MWGQIWFKRTDPNDAPMSIEDAKIMKIAVVE